MNDLDAFRLEIRSWLKANAPASLRGTRQDAGLFGGFWGGQKARDPDPDKNRWCALMAERGFNAPTWPREYGGAGLSRAEARVLDEELAREGLPTGVIGFGLAMLGPALLGHGDEEQKRTHLPRIADGTIRWCQGYSEPGAGSDLASLRTRAVRQGDHYVVSGQKIWTSYADKADWIFCLVRTAEPSEAVKKQAGISFLLFPMDDPGITVRPIELISGASPFCEVFLDEVRVPVANRVAAENQGWTVAKALLQHERASIGGAFGAQLRNLEGELVEAARRHLGAPEGPLPDAVVRDEIARASMRAACFGLACDQLDQRLRAGQGPGAESSTLKIVASELQQRRFELAMRVAGAAGLGWVGDGYDDADLKGTREWLRSRGYSIEGGTSEVQLDIIAQRVLGLPR